MCLLVKKTKKYGRALIAARDILAGEIVESSPVVILDSFEADRITPTILNCYAFDWNEGHSAIALGLGSLFNHSRRDNISYQSNYEKKTIDFIAFRDIKKGQQLFIDYGYDPKEAIRETSLARKTYE